MVTKHITGLINLLYYWSTPVVDAIYWLSQLAFITLFVSLHIYIYMANSYTAEIQWPMGSIK